MSEGIFYIVAGPIGNISDITYRAVEVLKSADLILSEDTRETDKVLKQYSIQTPQISYRDQNHDRVVGHILEALQSGKNIALVSDSGTPVISDPGFKLVRELRAKNVQILALPGPSAVNTAISISGLPTDKFTFLGFLPKGPNQRKELLQSYGALDSTLTIYESPYRVRRLLEEVQETLGNRFVFVAKDLTKMYEQTFWGPVQQILEKNDIKEKGEYVILIAKQDFYGPSGI